MKYIRYKMQVGEDAENPVLVDKQLRTHQEDISAILEEVKLEAYNGEYTVEDGGKYNHITAPHNIMEGEYVTIAGVLYKATMNIPNGEPIIVGQNAIATTIEEQLYELKGE